MTCGPEHDDFISLSISYPTARNYTRWALAAHGGPQVGPEARTSSEMGQGTSADVPRLEYDGQMQGCGGVGVLAGGRDYVHEAFFRAVLHIVEPARHRCVNRPGLLTRR